jgi:hypothetical protein
MKLEVQYGAVPVVALIPEDRRDTEIFHRLAEQNNIRVLYTGTPGATFSMEPMMVRQEEFASRLRFQLEHKEKA